MVEDDRREFQRLRLSKPILALMDGQSALILDIGVGGAFVEHYGTHETGDRFRLVFRWHGEDVDFLCQVARSTVVRPGGDGQNVVSHTGARFVEASPQSERRLQDMIATFVGRMLIAQKSNANADTRDPDSALILAQIGEARRSRSRGYLTFRLLNGEWTREQSTTSLQPEDGFTVAAFEDEDELETLCRAYENTDDEGRRLIRLVAELSAREVRRG